jgi:polysaccharide biosynthesis transport protein
VGRTCIEASAQEHSAFSVIGSELDMLASLLNANSKRIIHTLVLWSPLWVGTTVIFGCFGVIYGYLLKKDQWLASQGLLVREEANGASLRQGRFDSETQMKAAQETILEVARHHQVVGEALKTVGPEPRLFSWWGTSNWPSPSTIEATASSKISMRAPKGAEFGATEVVYLDVKQPSPERALQFCRALSDALEVRLQSVRKSKAESIVSELTHARSAARDQLRSITEQLQQFERTAGIELSDLRGMTDMIASGGNSRMHLDQLKSEIRSADIKHSELLDDLKLLQDAIADPSSLIIAPSNLVTSQPGLKRLREGYAEAQLSASQLSGKFTEVHPLLVAARTTQDSIRGRLVSELEASLGSLNQEIKTSKEKCDHLRALQMETEKKLGNLAENRADYANVVSEVKTRTTILENVERELAEAQATAEAASSTSLISRLDKPVVSEKPIGPGKTTIAGGCTLAGLLFGIGLVFVLSPNENGKSFGRRITDMGRRRQEDRKVVSQSQNVEQEEVSAPITPHTVSTPVVSMPVESIPVESPEAEPPTKPVDRLKRTLAVPGGRRERPAPILYDETNLYPKQDNFMAVEAQAIDFATSAALVEQAEIHETQTPTAPASEEHPKDGSFRDFLMSEIQKNGDRRQQPREAKPKPANASLSLRSAPANKPNPQ